MNKYVSLLLALSLAAFWNASLMEWYLATRHEKPLVMAQIPESTRRFLVDLNNRLLTGINDHFIIHQVDSLPPDSWDNSGDYGHQTNMAKHEHDTLFMFYADVEDSILVNNARQYAYEAINPMTRLMGKYVYPYMVKGRKLPIYLCTKEGSYQEVCSKLVGSNSDFSDSWGLCVTQYSGTEVMTVGIAVNYYSISARGKHIEEYFKSTLWHEMNHYVYFQSLKLSREVTPYVWVFEGLAEYFASKVWKQTTRLSAEERRKGLQNKLESTFTPFIFNYSGGELFYEYLERKYGEDRVESFIRKLYEYPLPESLSGIGLGTEQCEKEWKEYIRTYY